MSSGKEREPGGLRASRGGTQLTWKQEGAVRRGLYVEQQGRDGETEMLLKSHHPWEGKRVGSVLRGRTVCPALRPQVGQEAGRVPGGPRRDVV